MKKINLYSLHHKNFTFIVKDKKYQCNLYGILSSKVIKELREKDPNTYQYEYDFDEQNNEFQVICDFFNFKDLIVTSENMKSLQQIAEDLQIECIYDTINNYIDSCEKALQQSEAINEIFNNLHRINKSSVESIKNYIIKSIWVQSYENIQELAAFIFQVVKNNYDIQPFIIDLLIMLNESSKETEHLKHLLPFIINKLMFCFYKSPLLCSFVYKMSKKGLIPINEIIDKICSKDPKLSNKSTREKYYELSTEIFKINDHNNVLLWFLPELLEKNSINQILHNINSLEKNFIQQYIPNDIEYYKKIRDSEEPENELRRSIFHDDVNTLQSIISMKNIDVSTGQIKGCLHDVNNISYINYAAERGSVKCFKYLLLNNARIDENTLKFAVHGRNTEIIRIVDNSYRNKQKSYENAIIEAIKMHSYDLFDWIFDNKYNRAQIKDKDTKELIKIAVTNGNFYSVIRIINNGFDLSKNVNTLYDLILYSSKFGFYQLTQFLLSQENVNFSDSDIYESSINFGNISIFKLFYNKENNLRYNFKKLQKSSIKHGYFNIVKYIGNFYQPLEKDAILCFLKNAMKLKSPDIFNYLIKQNSMNHLKNYFKFSSNDFLSILKKGIPFQNYERAEIIINFVMKKFPNADFTNLLIHSGKLSSKETCIYFVNKKVPININKILENIQLFIFDDEKFSTCLIENSDESLKEQLSNHFTLEYQKINQNKNTNILFNENIFDYKVLFSAVKKHDLEFVEKILDFDSSPSFVNQISAEGTALHIAVSNNDIKIVQRLLSVPEINVNLYNLKKGDTPLISAIKNKNEEIAQLLIQNPQTDINFRNIKQKTALTIASKRQLESIVSLLLKNEKFDSQKSRLDYAFFISVDSISKKLYSLDGLNVNYMFNYNKQLWTTLQYAISQKQIKKVDMILKHQSFDPKKSQILEAIILSIKKNQPIIVKKLISYAKNILKLPSSQYEYILLSIVNEKPEILKELLDSECFEFRKEIFLKIFLAASIKLKKVLLDYDKQKNHFIDFNHLLSNGKSFFTQISLEISDLSEIVQFLLDNNADPNLPDKFGVYPLEHAININSYEFVKTLVNTEKIDFSVRMKKTKETYLHLAAQCKDSEIMQIIFKKCENDKNSVDKYGETPMMKAVNASNIKNIKMLDRKDEKNKKLENLDSVNYSDKKYWFTKQEAFRFHKNLAENGDIYGINGLGCHYLLGSGVPTNYEEAIKCFKIAADRNNYNGIINYAFMVDNGLGVPVNHKIANEYYQFLIDHGKTYIFCSLAKVLENYQMVPNMKEKVCNYYKMAADECQIEGLYNYGRMLETGFGIQVNIENAKYYYKLAADRGHTEALEALNALK